MHNGLKNKNQLLLLQKKIKKTKKETDNKLQNSLRLVFKSIRLLKTHQDLETNLLLNNVNKEQKKEEKETNLNFLLKISQHCDQQQINYIKIIMYNQQGHKKYLIKRKAGIQMSTIQNKSNIFSHDKINSQHEQISKTSDKIYTLNTNHDTYGTINSLASRNVTINSQNQEGLVQTTLSKVIQTQRFQNKQTLPQIKIKQNTIKLKQLSHHASDPFYIRLQKTLAKRTINKLQGYKKGWNERIMRRKGKSVVERSLQKAQIQIVKLNEQNQKRKKSSHIGQLLRDNYRQKKLISLGQIHTQINGLKGHGGKVIPLYNSNYFPQEVYKHNKEYF